MIDTNAKLLDYLPALQASPWVALDTEADSLHAYPEKLCLLQIGTIAGEVLVDPLNGANLAPLFDALTGRQLIMHGADYDLRLLRKHCKFLPHSIFDTMIAGRLLGQREFGLGALAQSFLGVTLEKGAQKANWARRPLTPRMELYALNDVKFLRPLAEKLEEGLAMQGRLDWHREACDRLIADAATETDADPDTVWRIKGSSLLGRPALAVLRELWSWREHEAIHANLPPFFIMSHELLVRLAVGAVAGESVNDLVPPRYSPRRKETLQRAVERGLAVPPDKQPQIPKRHHQRLTMAQVRRLRELTKRRDRHASRLGIDPALIASKPVLARLSHDWEANQSELMSWQKVLLQ